MKVLLETNCLQKGETMKLRILAMATLMAMITSTASTTAFAFEGAADSVVATEAADATLETSTVDPTAHPPRWSPAPRRLVCYARNVTGRTFAAWGNFRTPPRWVQQRAMQICRNNSGFFRFSCRSLGCRWVR